MHNKYYAFFNVIKKPLYKLMQKGVKHI